MMMVMTTSILTPSALRFSAGRATRSRTSISSWGASQASPSTISHSRRISYLQNNGFRSAKTLSPPSSSAVAGIAVASASPGSSSSHKAAKLLSLVSATAAAFLFASQYKSISSDHEPLKLAGKPQIIPQLPDIAHIDPRLLDNENAPMRRRMEVYIKLLQHNIVKALQAEEPEARFLVDSWTRKEGGEGISCVLQDGATFEKAGCNISIVHGKLPLGAIKQMASGKIQERLNYRMDGPDPEVDSLPFVALGLSLVVHPVNPFAPTVHFNYRYFEIAHPKTLKDGSPNPRYKEAKKAGDSEPPPAAWWFGGGTDLTPIYLFEEDAKHFHSVLKTAADANDPAFYPTWKKWCDDYFVIPHRSETRGVGGIFFDDLTLPASWNVIQTAQLPKEYIALTAGGGPSDPRTPITSTKQHDIHSLFKTIRALGDAFIPAYIPLVQKRKIMPYGLEHVDWQGIRRGRYVEFNLVYDRGTKFGLQTPGARIESILMSLPLKARWKYMHEVNGTGRKRSVGTENSSQLKEERKLQAVLEKPREWA